MLGVGGPLICPGLWGIFSSFVLLEAPPVLSVMSSLSMLPLLSEKLNGLLLYPAMSGCDEGRSNLDGLEVVNNVDIWDSDRKFLGNRVWRQGLLAC